MKIALAAVITVFWCTMMGILVRREVLPTLQKGTTLTYRTLLAWTEFPTVEKFEIRVGGAPIGTLQTSYQKDGEGGACHIENILTAKPALTGGLLPLGAASAVAQIRAQWTLFLDERLQPARLSVEAQAPGLGVSRFEAQGWFKENLFLSYGVNDGPRRAMTLECPPGTLFGLGLGWIGTIRGMRLGQTWNMASVDLLSSFLSQKMSTQVILFEVASFEKRPIDGKSVPTYTVLARVPGGSVIELWFSELGELLRAQVAGMELVRIL